MAYNKIFMERGTYWWYSHGISTVLETTR